MINYEEELKRYQPLEELKDLEEHLEQGAMRDVLTLLQAAVKQTKGKE